MYLKIFEAKSDTVNRITAAFKNFIKRFFYLKYFKTI